MSHIVLNDQQLQALNHAKNGVIEVLDPQGKSLGYLEIASEEEIIAECKRRRDANEGSFSFAQVRTQFRALEEAAKQGASEEQLLELLRKIQDEPRARAPMRSSGERGQQAIWRAFGSRPPTNRR
jgi:hypothetical protein